MNNGQLIWEPKQPYYINKEVFKTPHNAQKIPYAKHKEESSSPLEHSSERTGNQINNI